MQIDRLELEGFRNYARQAADFDPRCNVVCGENAQGKTNLLEAVAYLSRADCFFLYFFKGVIYIFLEVLYHLHEMRFQL